MVGRAAVACNVRWRGAWRATKISGGVRRRRVALVTSTSRGHVHESSLIDIGAGVFVLGHNFFMSAVLGQNTQYVF
jgi:hypothetical protein